MAKRIALIFVLTLAFLSLVSCSSLLSDYNGGTLPSLTPSTTATTDVMAVTTQAVTATEEPSVPVIAPVTTAKSNGITVIVDAGHGGNDPGAGGAFCGVVYWEEDINLSVALKLREELVSLGYDVVMIREKDESMLGGKNTTAEAKARRDYSSELGADLYISLHCNSYAGSGRAWGPIIFYNGRGTFSPYECVGILAECVTGIAEEFTEMRECRIIDDGDYIVLQNKNIPSFLIEMGFISDGSDIKMLIDESWQSALADALADGIEKMKENNYIG